MQANQRCGEAEFAESRQTKGVAGLNSPKASKPHLWWGIKIWNQGVFLMSIAELNDKGVDFDDQKLRDLRICVASIN